jgi:putative hydroxymethylpyrimidine transport system substrate-binding protein
LHGRNKIFFEKVIFNMKKVRALLCALIMLLTLLSGTVFAQEKLTVMLDWFPNIDHLPLYVAQEKGIFDQFNLDVSIVSPSETSDPLKLAAASHIDIAIGYEPQIIIAASSNIGIKAVGRLVGHPLTTLLFIGGKDIETPSDLEGKKIGYTVPGMMDHLTDGFAKENGLKNYELINVGFTIIPSLTSGKVDAIMGPYKNYEVVELEQHGYTPGYFELEKHGIPDYDELVFVTGNKTLQEKEDSIRRFKEAVQEAINVTRQNPEEALEAYLKAVPEASRELETAAFGKTIDLYAEEQTFSVEKWQKFADFALSIGMVSKEVQINGILWNGK